MAESVKERLPEFLKTISSDLDSTINFWVKHSVDKEQGGFFQCLDVDGSVYDTNKHSWLMCRQVWMLARLYRAVERFHRPDILEAANTGAEFILKHVKNPSTGRCYISMTREGAPIKMQRTIFSEAFYMMATSEMYLLTGQERYKEEAVSTMQNIVHWVREDNTAIGLSVKPPSNTSSLSVPMILLMLIGQLETARLAQGDGAFPDLAKWCIDKVTLHVVQRKDGPVVLETVGEQGQEVSGSAGRLINPGHAIEAGWFLLERAVKEGQEELKTLALDAFISGAFQRGWDDQFGGILYFVDVDNRPLTQLEWDMKLWWPHNEAMIAFLMAYRHTGKDEYLQTFAHVFDYSYKHFADPARGAWFGYLSREGDIKIHAKGGPWKGCFHVPRSLMMCEQLLKEILHKA